METRRTRRLRNREGRQRNVTWHGTHHRDQDVNDPAIGPRHVRTVRRRCQQREDATIVGEAACDHGRKPVLARPGERGLEQPAGNATSLKLVADRDPQLKLGRAHVCETQVANDPISS